MADHAFTTMHDSSKTVYARFMRVADGFIFDKSGKTWKVNAAACTQPNWPATERTDYSDADESLYAIALDPQDINSQNPIREYLIQWVDDLGTDEVIDTESFRVAGGQIVEPGS